MQIVEGNAVVKDGYAARFLGPYLRMKVRVPVPGREVRVPRLELMYI